MMRAADAWSLAGGSACFGLLVLTASACTLLIDSQSLVGVNGGAANGGAPNGGAPNGGTSVAGAANGGEASGGTANAGANCIPNDAVPSCDGLDSSCLATLEEPECPAGCKGATLSGISYMGCTASATFSDAEVLCQQQRMHLVAIDSATENTFVVQLAQSLGSYVWIGGSDLKQNSSFAWENGAIFFADGAPLEGVYQNFAANEPAADPARHCVHLHDDPPGYWLTTRCTESKQFICERY